jgi:hypothetical protein
MVNGTMFKFAMERQVLWPVTINVPIDGGETQEMEIRVRYRLLTQDEMTARAHEDLAAARAASTDQSPIEGLLAAIEPEGLKKRLDQLKACITGWEGIADAEGNPLPFTATNLEAVLNVPYLRTPIASGLMEASRGAPAKNSKAGSAG